MERSAGPEQGFLGRCVWWRRKNSRLVSLSVQWEQNKISAMMGAYGGRKLGAVEAFGSCVDFDFIFSLHCFGSDRDEPKVTARCGVATNALKPCLAAPPALDVRSRQSVLMKPQTSFQLWTIAGVAGIGTMRGMRGGRMGDESPKPRLYQEVGFFWLGWRAGGLKANTQNIKRNARLTSLRTPTTMLLLSFSRLVATGSCLARLESNRSTLGGPAQPWMSTQRCRGRPMLQWRSESEGTRTPREGGDKELKRSTMAAKHVEEGRFLASGGVFRLGWTIR